MNEADILIDQIQATYSGNAWHGSNIIDTLKDIDYIEARNRVIAERHTIWELVDHMAVWLEVPTKILLEKKDYHDLPYEINWKPMGNTQEDWENTVKRLERAIDNIISVIADTPRAIFDEKVLDRKFTYRTMLNGALHHNLYHLGQIAILKNRR
jgi:uncharacterized damage-inducible protein DinB